MIKLEFSNNNFETNDFLGGTITLTKTEIDQTTSKIEINLNYDGVFGLGEKFNSLNQKGNKVTNKVFEKFCFQGEHTYNPTPFFFTDTGFAIFVDTDEVTTFDFKKQTIEIELPNESEVYIKTGTPKEIISAYMDMGGKAILPPRWAFLPWISANRWNTELEVLKQIELLKKHDFPAGVVVVEAWSDEATFYIFNGATYTPKPFGQPLEYSDFDFSKSKFWKNPKEMIQKLHQNGLKLVLWQIPVYKKQGEDETLNQQNELDREDAKKRSLCVMTKENKPYLIPKDRWFGGSMIPDFKNPETIKTWFSKRRYLLDIGVDGFKTDGGEFIYSDDATFCDGTTGKQGVNRYPQDYTKAYTDFIGQKRVLFSRAGYTGQHTTACHWGGDQQSTDDELKSVFKAGLSSALSGIIMWGFDIGGFAGGLPSLDLYRRATMLACFCPLMQWHSEPDGGQFKELMPGIEGNNERSPWNIAISHNSPEFIDEMRYWHYLRVNLIPYIYSSAYFAAKKSEPLMRSLVYDFFGDKKASQNETQYMLGSSLLVAPLLEKDSYSREVYFPKGRWFSLFSSEVFDGEQTVCCKNEKIPVFLRQGFGVLLNKPQNKDLGESFDYKNQQADLFLLLAGNSGKDSFWFEQNEFSVSWEQGKVVFSDNAPKGLEYKILEGQQSV